MIAWKEWEPSAFAQARSLGKPVLLLLPSGASADELERAFGALDGALGNGCILVCAQRCDRPDLYLRYGAGKTALLLTDDGRVVDRFPIEAEALAAAVSWRLKRFKPPPPEPMPLISEAWTGAVGPKRGGALRPQAPRQAVAALLERESLELSGVELLLYAAAEWQDAQALRRVERELGALAGRLDSEGALRSAGVAALGAQAAACRVFWEAFALTQQEDWRRAASALSGFIAGRHYDPQSRAFHHVPNGSSAIFADENAQAIVALQRAAAFEPGQNFGRFAAEALATLESSYYDPLLGMLHRRQPGGTMVYGLLGDTAWTMLAFTEAFQATGHKPHREFADGLARFLFQELWDRDGGGFCDRIAQQDDVGLLKERRLARPEDNAAAFEGLWRLHHLKGNANYRRWLEWGLLRFDSHDGAAAAGIFRVQDMLSRGRLDLELVGRPGQPDAEALLGALGRFYAPRRIVSFVDPDDQDYILAHKLETPARARLYGCVELRPVASTEDPQGVSEVLRRLRL